MLIIETLADLMPLWPHSLTEIVHSLRAVGVPLRAARRIARAVARCAYRRQATRPCARSRRPAKA